MTWYLVKQRDRFTFTLPLHRSFCKVCPDYRPESVGVCCKWHPVWTENCYTPLVMKLITWECSMRSHWSRNWRKNKKKKCPSFSVIYFGRFV